MCDYSLCGIPNRLAIEGEELVFHRFPTASMGLASPAELAAIEQPRKESAVKGFWNRLKTFFELPPPRSVRAVCVPPGALLVLKNIPPDLQRQFEIGPEEPVVFTQLSLAVNTYRDAVQFRNGRQARLQDLHTGIRAEVGSLAGATQAADPVWELERVR